MYNKEQFKKIRKVIKLARKIAKSDILDWEDRYDAIFELNIWRTIDKLDLPGFSNWYDPDTSYEEDIKAYLTALTEWESRTNTLLKEFT